MGAHFRHIGRYFECVLESQIFHVLRPAVAQNNNVVYDACFYSHFAAVFDGVHPKIVDRRADDLFPPKQRQIVSHHDFIFIFIPLLVVVFGA